MKSKKAVILFVALILVVVLGGLYESSTYISMDNIKTVVEERQTEGMEYMELLEKDGKSDIYETMFSFPNKTKLNKFINVKYIERIAAFPDEYTIIYFKHPPKGYTGWGIYYQKDNKMKGYSGLKLYEDCIIDDNTYRYDGRKSDIKQNIVYESERICDNWFFFKEEFWN